MARNIDLDEFYEYFFQEIVSTSTAEQIYKEEALFNIFTDYLIDAGEFEDAVYAHYQPSGPGVRIDGFCGDPLEASIAGAPGSSTLGVIILDFDASTELNTITNTDVNAIYKRALNFVSKARDPFYKKDMEESSSGYELADLVSKRWDVIERVRIILLTNRALSSRASGKANDRIDNKAVIYDLWDVSRLHRLVQSGREKEPLHIDFNELPGGPLRALHASSDSSSMDVYLAAIPGIDLAAIYDRWGTRLLEQNVRVFLQARSKVNKGIKATLEQRPEYFFSFNNGLTATAEAIKTEETSEGLKITQLENLQIVNGGQTTASVYSAYKNKINISDVFVQMKLSIVSPAKAEELVPEISRSANSQNKVSDADFFSNHPFHVRIEDFSRRIYAPPSEGSFNQSKWFYERARGQYLDAQAYLTASKRAKFNEEYPKNQKFTKTDLAKYRMVWTPQAYIVNKGAQKCFAEFAKLTTEAWEKNNEQFSEYYFRCSIAKKIIFNTMEKVVAERPWYEAGDYRSQHVALAIGYLSHSVRAIHKEVNFEGIWSMQRVSEPMREAMAVAADIAHVVLKNPQSSKNISEWAKMEACWTALVKEKATWPEEWLSELLSAGDVREAKAEAKKDQRQLNGIEAQTLVVQAGSDFWKDVERWALSNNEYLSETEQRYLRLAKKISQGTIPTDIQSEALVQMMGRLGQAGCPHKLGKSRGGRLERARARRR